MLELIILYLHLVLFIYVFTKNWQELSKKDGVLSVLLMILVFIIGWAISGTIANLIYPTSYNTVYFNKDTFGLCILTIPEFIFYYYYFFKNEKEEDEKTK